MPDDYDRIIAKAMEDIMTQGSEGIAPVFTRLFNLAMLMERERFLGAGHYQRCDERDGHANGYKDKKIDTPVGTLNLDIPQTRSTEKPFYPQSLERGRRSSRAVMMAVAQMYINGVSTRDVEKVMGKFGLENLSSTQVSRATKQLDEDLEKWRNRPLEVIRYLILDARYEKVRLEGIVRDVAVFSAVGVGLDGRRSLLGVSTDLSEAEVHWRSFLESLVARGMRGVEFIVSDDHAGLKAARKAVFGGVKWQRCQFHLAQNASHHAPSLKTRKRIGKELRQVWNAPDLDRAKEELARLVTSYHKDASKLADWLEKNVPEGLSVFTLPEKHQKKMRTSNGIERGVQQEIKRRTVKIRIFPNESSLLRLVTAVLVEIDEKWTTEREKYISWNTDDA